jgi:hypothetical protein
VGGIRRYAEDPERGYGWVAFAGTLLLILGTLNGTSLITR